MTAVGILLGTAWAWSAAAEPPHAGKAGPNARASKADQPVAAAAGAAAAQAAAPAAKERGAAAEAKAKSSPGKAQPAAAHADPHHNPKAKGEKPGKGRERGHAGELKAQAEESDAVSSPRAPAEPGAGHAERAKFKNAMAELRERYARGELKKADLKKELAALKESRSERRKQHRQELKERWGDSLAEPAAREELRRHERRTARLRRLLLLAETERTGKAKEKLIERIEKLMAREDERHERKMSRFRAQAANTRPASVVEGATPAKTAAAPHAEKGAAR